MPLKQGESKFNDSNKRNPSRLENYLDEFIK